jgi:hypothetical protein
MELIGFSGPRKCGNMALPVTATILPKFRRMWLLGLAGLRHRSLRYFMKPLAACDFLQLRVARATRCGRYLHHGTPDGKTSGRALPEVRRFKHEVCVSAPYCERAANHLVSHTFEPYLKVNLSKILYFLI